MKSSVLKTILLIAIYLLTTDLAFAQKYWREQYTDNTISDINRDVLSISDGNYLVACQQGEGTAKFMKIQFNGDVLWQSHITGLGDASFYWGNVYYDGLELADGSFIYTAQGDYGDTLALLKLDPNGQLQWMQQIPNNVNGSLDEFEIYQTSDLGYLVYGNSYTDAVTELDSRLFKFDDQGNLEWSQTYPLPGNQRYGRMYMNDDGTAVFAHSTQENYQVDLYKVDATGTVLWNDTMTHSGGNIVRGVEKDVNGRYLVVGLGGNVTKVNEDGSIHSWIDPQGITLAAHFALRSNGNYAYQTDDMIRVTDTLGYLLWSEEIIGNNFSVRSFKETVNNGFILSGIYENLSTSIWHNVVVSVDSLGAVNNNAIGGFVYADLNENCVQDPQEPGIPNLVVEVSQNNMITYVSTDSNGYFVEYVDLGTYDVTVMNTPPNADFSSCNTNTQSVTYNTYYNFDTISFYQTSVNDCPMLSIDLVTNVVRACDTLNNTISYCNEALLMANDVEVELVLDPNVQFLNASIPFSNVVGNTYYFDVGDIAALDCGSIHFETYIDCDSTSIGQIICNEAYITPDTICDIDSAWSGASLRAEASCLGNDSVLLTLRNVGNNNMDNPASVVVIEDVIMIIDDQVQLNSNEEMSWSMPYAAATYRITGEQPVGHPLSTYTTAAVSECDLTAPFPTIIDNATFNIFPNDEESPFVAIECEPIVGSYDPNDKSVMPVGSTEEHFILADTDLEYRIRFQNTGSDTAFVVTIIDTISPNLDLTTIKPGAASHPYQFELYGPRIAKFTFDNILLVDSLTDEPNSHGYVKYKISQVPNHPDGTLITNEADIYFDYNPPINTNKVFNTIGQVIVDTVLIQDSVINEISEITNVQVQTYPNPVSEYVVFEWEQFAQANMKVVVYDLQGKVVLTKEVTDNMSSIRLYRSQLQAGMYLFELQYEHTPIASGKLLFE